MARKEVSYKSDEYYINSKGYTREQIDDFDTDRAVTMFVATVQREADYDPQSGTLLFSEKIKKEAQREQRMREENPDLDN
jgi:hypothetical protein